MTPVCTKILTLCLVDPQKNGASSRGLGLRAKTEPAVPDMTPQQKLHMGLISFFDALSSNERLRAATIFYNNEIPTDAFNALVEVFGKRFVWHFPRNRSICRREGDRYTLDPDVEVSWVELHRDFVEALMYESVELEQRLYAA